MSIAGGLHFLPKYGRENQIQFIGQFAIFYMFLCASYDNSNMPPRKTILALISCSLFKKYKNTLQGKIPLLAQDHIAPNMTIMMTDQCLTKIKAYHLNHILYT